MHNQRNRRAAQARTPRSKHKTKRKQRPAKVFGAFPNDVTVPPHCGASPRAIDFSPLVASPLAMLTSGFVPSVAQPPVALPTLVATTGSTAIGERAETRLTPRSVSKVEPTTARRKPVKTKSEKLKPTKAAKIRPAIALPVQAEPLVARGQALVVYREGGMLGPLGQWLSAGAAALWRRLGGVASPRKAQSRRAQLHKSLPRKSKVRKSERPAADHIQRLVAENARLKAQLDALQTQQLPPSQSVALGAQENALLRSS